MIKFGSDNKLVWQKNFPTGAEGEGEWKKSEWKKEWKIWFSTYDKAYAIDVPAGEHVIRLENTGRDWIMIKRIILTNYRSNVYPSVRQVGLRRNGEALLWIQNTESNWYTNSLKKEPTPQRDLCFNVLDMPQGTYELEWWDTWEGKIINETEAISIGRELPIRLPELKTDIAVKISLSTDE